MDENEKGLVMDWLKEIIENPTEWRDFYSDSEVQLLAQKTMELITA